MLCAQETTDATKKPDVPKDSAVEKEIDPFSNDIHDDESTPEPLLIQTIEYIQLPLVDVSRLLFDENLISDSVKLRAALGVMLKNGTAHIHDTLCTVTSEHKKAQTESTLEFIYATEYEPPEIPSSILIPENKIENPELMRALGQLKTPPTPTAFEPRNVGNSFTTETFLEDDGKTATITIEPEIVTFIDWMKYNEAVDIAGNKHDIRMPKFYVMRMNAQVTVATGKPQLIGLHSAQGKDGQPDPSQKIIAILRCHAITPSPAK